MKRLFLGLILTFFGFVAHAQCVMPETGTVLKWTSETHDPSDSSYRTSPLTLAPPMDQLGPIDYVIEAYSGNEPFSYEFKAGSGDVFNGYAGIISIQLINVSNNQPTALATSLGTLYSTGKIPAKPNKAPSSIVYIDDLPPGVSRTFTIPENPYHDRTLTIVISVFQVSYTGGNCNRYPLPDGYYVDGFKNENARLAIIIPPNNSKKSKASE